MLISVQQHDASVTLSYAENGLITTKTYPVAQYNNFGPYNYRIANDPNDPEIIPNLKHFKDDLPVKRVKSWRMEFDSLRHFLLYDIPKEDHDKIYTTEMPIKYTLDIEIAVGDEDIFPDPWLAAKPIDSIQITAPSLNTVVLTWNPRVKSPNTTEGTEQVNKIEEAINQHYKDVPYVQGATDRIKYSQIVYGSETEMIIAFLGMVKTRLHSVSFWNGDGFDKPYLWNRCRKLGIDMGMGSPVGEASERDMWPRHRLCVDDMKIVDKFANDLRPKLSLALNYITERVLGEGNGKIKYDGTFSDLFNGPIVRYMTYGAVDTIGQQIIHLMKNYSAAEETMAYFCKMPITDIGKTTAQVHSVIWDELYGHGLINGEEFVKKEKTPYGGGYVKQPTRKFVMYPTGVDFSALYPRKIQTCNISFENYQGKVKNEEHRKALAADPNYFVTVEGNYYKNDKDYCLKRVQDKFLGNRYLYKDLQFTVWQKIIPILETELKSRGINLKDIK